jgi:hypothetical protein
LVAWDDRLYRTEAGTTAAIQHEAVAAQWCVAARLFSQAQPFELDHAQDIIADFMDTVVKGFRPPFRG